MFEALAQRLQTALGRVRGRGRLDPATVDATLKDIRLALLEADVNHKVVRGIIDRLRAQLVGADVAPALDPAQQVIKAVHEELTRALGGQAAPLELGSRRPAAVVLAGLQGSGKTTAAGKLARWLREQGRRPMLVACDLQRPAAVEQLRVLADAAGVPIYAPVDSGDPVPVAAEGVDAAVRAGCDVVVVDTAGRLHIDEEMLTQARRIREVVSAEVAARDGGRVETLFVIDAMVGQEAVNVARAFLDRVGFEGVVLAKLDGDARGGAALSVTEVTGRPIRFASTGEKLEDFDVFHPDRLAGRILGMGDVLTLIERAERTYTEAEARRAEQALLEGQFTLEDLLEQMRMVRRLGPLKGVLGMLPGIDADALDVDERQLARVEAIIRSMTPAERRDPRILNASRRRRIAAGSGTTVQEVNRLVRQFGEAQKLLRSLTRGGGRGRRGGDPLLEALRREGGAGVPRSVRRAAARGSKKRRRRR